MYAGIDIGFGYTKVAFNNKTFSFKSTVEPYIPTEKIFGQAPEIVYVRENGYLVGPYALPKSQVPKDFVGTEAYYAVVGYCLNEIYKHAYQLKGIALGLPPAMFNERKIILLRNNIERLDLSINKRLLSIPENIVFIPQGVGAYIDFISNNPDYADKDTIVIDVGYYTLDVIYVSDGKFMSQASMSYPAGVEFLLSRICDEFVNKYGEFINPSIAETLLEKGEVSYLGRKYKLDMESVLNSYLIEITKLVKEYATFLKNNHFKIQNIQAVILCGGGASYLKELTDDIIILPEPQFANARGYKIYLEQTFGWKIWNGLVILCKRIILFLWSVIGYAYKKHINNVKL